MADLQLTYGSDLTVDATGDLTTVDSTEEGQERVIRRLLTNAGDYIWHVKYGAGIASYIGKPAAPTRIAGVSRAQMLLEKAVAQTPPPSVAVSVQKNGVVTLDIKYVDGDTGSPVPLTVPVGG